MRHGGGPGDAGGTGPRGPVGAVPAPRRLAEVPATSDDLLARADGAVAAVAAVLRERSALVGTAGVPALPVDAAGLRARHAAQRGIRFGALASGAADLRTAATAVRTHHRALVDEAGVLWERWSGPSADDAADRVVMVARAAQEVVTLLEEAADLVEATGLAVADDVTARAEAAAALVDRGQALPPPPDAADGARAVRVWAARLDTRLHHYLAVADRTDAAIAAAWRDLAAHLGVLRRPPGAGASGEGAAAREVDVDALPPDLLALPEILAALGPLGVPPDDTPPGQTVDDSR